MILKFYFIFCAIATGLMTTFFLSIIKHVKEKHPNAKYKKTLPIERIQGLMTIIALCVCPIFHLFTITILLFISQDIIDETIWRIEENIISEN
jgi:hypothetical protein